MFYDLLELARSRQIFNARRDVILKLGGPGQLSNCSNPPLGVRVSEDASPDHNMAAQNIESACFNSSEINLTILNTLILHVLSVQIYENDPREVIRIMECSPSLKMIRLRP